MIKEPMGDDLAQDILLGHAFNLLKGTCSSSIELEYNFQECFNALIEKLDWNNPEGYRYLFDLSKPLSLQGPLGYRTVDVDYFFNNDLEYLKTSDQSTIKHAYEKDAEKEIKQWGCKMQTVVPISVVKSYQKKLNITKPQKTFPEIEFKEPYTPSYDPLGIVYEDLNKQKRVLRADELYMFSDGTLKSVRDEIRHRVLEFRLDYNTEMPKRKWTIGDRKRSGLMVELIDKLLRERKIIKNLERLVGARELEMDYKLMTRTVYPSHDPARTGGVYPGHSQVSVEVHSMIEKKEEKISDKEQFLDDESKPLPHAHTRPA
ncbi:hypothetical protein Tco_0459895 [Tanacetum coccineum]